jgi:hypothetical protein
VSDNLRRYRAIKQALKQLYPKEPKGNLARHLNTLAGLMSGIVGSQRTNLPQVASKVPDGTESESRVKRFSRWLNNERLETETYFLPFAEALLVSLSQQTLVLVMDGSEVGRGCLTLMVSVVYKQRALPIAWLVVEGNKGHFPCDTHVRLLNHVQPMIPAEADVIVLGDGEFDGVPLQAAIESHGWEYVCRTAKNIILRHTDEEFAFESVEVEPGELLSLPEVTLRQHTYGPVHAIAWWDKDYAEPIYLLTNMALEQEACHWYRKRFRIETFFSDQKSRGFHLHKSHISEPERLTRLMMAACLAYIWMIYLGVLALHDEWRKFVHRTDRCDLSLFQLGLRLLDHLVNEGKRIPVRFQMSE